MYATPVHSKGSISKSLRHCTLSLSSRRRFSLRCTKVQKQQIMAMRTEISQNPPNNTRNVKVSCDITMTVSSIRCQQSNQEKGQNVTLVISAGIFNTRVSEAHRHALKPCFSSDTSDSTDSSGVEEHLLQVKPSPTQRALYPMRSCKESHANIRRLLSVISSKDVP